LASTVAKPKTTPIRNRLLASLPPDVLAALLPKMRHVTLTLRNTLLAADAEIEHVYFPEAGMISLVAIFADGKQGEVGIIGREGMFGAALLSGVSTNFTEANVQMTGSAFCMSASDLRCEIMSDGPLRATLLRYNEALSGQISQTAACNGNHEIEERLARWLLMAHDRGDSDELALTQEFMAIMLGVHRPSVTVSAGILQRAGFISYSRGGKVTIIDRAGLEGAACECYSAVVRRFATVMGSKA
jgi:CRP-like cAMP-binding protein